jgi:8-amino-7-oxononanoate synthase
LSHSNGNGGSRSNGRHDESGGDSSREEANRNHRAGNAAAFVPATIAEKRALLKQLLASRGKDGRQSSGDGAGRGPANGNSHSTTLDDIPVEHYRFENSPEYLNLRGQMDAALTFGIEYPYFKVIEPRQGATAFVNGRECVNYSSYNYVGMSGDPIVAAAAKAAIDRLGTSASASRLVAGQRALHRELEQALADHLATPDAVVFVTGYLTGLSTIGHLMKPGDLILHDELIHNCSLIGSKLSGARMMSFPHNDTGALERILQYERTKFRKVLIVAEGIYSMDGDIADLPGLIALKRRFKTYLMIDEAHSIGVLGANGRGIGEHYGVDPADVDLWMGTLSKAMGSCGGYIAGSKPMIDYLRHTTPGFVYSVGMPPPVAGAALAALNLLRAQPERLVRLRDVGRLFLERARAKGLDTGLSGSSPVVPVIVGESRRAGALAQALYRRGINVQPIIFPAVEDRAARLRFFLTCLHTDQQIVSTVDAVADELARLSSGTLTARD